MNTWNPTLILTSIALGILGILAFILTWHEVPTSNEKMLTFILGVLAGAVTTTAAQKIVSAPDQPQDPQK